MKNFDNFNEVIDFALRQEQEAIDFYLQLAENAVNNEMKLVFKEFAEEEITHKVRLMNIKTSQINDLTMAVVQDLKISDYVVSTNPHENMTYEEALILAMNKEKAAFKLYTKLAERVVDINLKNIFLGLAIEESKHKLRFELEFDEYVMRDN